jgi:bifunctional non-homologous end joining protein LigD
LTSPERVLFPEQGITKRGLAEYYVEIADWIMPHVAGRPLSTLRCPEGPQDQCFFQKHPPNGLSDAVERISIEEKNGPDTYLVANDVRGLVALVQFGVLEFHVWGSRADDVERPDRLIFDLDPDPAVSWKDVVQAAIELRKLLGTIELESFVKTSGV